MTLTYCNGTGHLRNQREVTQIYQTFAEQVTERKKTEYMFRGLTNEIRLIPYYGQIKVMTEKLWEGM